jgi:hypothetical protein
MGEAQSGTQPIGAIMYNIFVKIVTTLILFCIVEYLPFPSRFSSDFLKNLWICASIAGLGLVPISAFGLLRNRTWGVWLLLVASLLFSLSNLNQGLFHMVSICALHYTLLGVVLLRMYVNKRQSVAQKIPIETPGK